MKTASTSEERHNSSTEVNQWAMPCSLAESWARCGSRRESAVTSAFCAMRKPGIKRFTACSPNPAMPNRTIALVLRNYQLPLPVTNWLITGTGDRHHGRACCPGTDYAHEVSHADPLHGAARVAGVP